MNPQKSRRNRDIQWLRQQGCTLRQIAERYGISTQRVSAIAGNVRRDDTWNVTPAEEAHNWRIVRYDDIRTVEQRFAAGFTNEQRAEADAYLLKLRRWDARRAA